LISKRKKKKRKRKLELAVSQQEEVPPSKRGGLDYSFLLLGVVVNVPQLLLGCGEICRALYAGRVGC
jgi:hypothetical protein